MARKRRVVKSVLSAGAPVIAMRKSRNRKSSDLAVATDSSTPAAEPSLEDMFSETLKKLYAPTVTPNSTKFDEAIEIAHRLELLAWHHAEQGMALEILSITRGFLSLVIQMLMIRRAFELSPRRSIDGPGGVGQILNLSRTTVLHEVKKLGLESDDFRDPRLCLRDLMERSDPICELIRRLKELDTRFGAKMREEGIIKDLKTLPGTLENPAGKASEQGELSRERS